MAGIFTRPHNDKIFHNIVDIYNIPLWAYNVPWFNDVCGFWTIYFYYNHFDIYRVSCFTEK